MTEVEIRSLDDKELIRAYDAATIEGDPLLIDRLADELERREIDF